MDVDPTPQQRPATRTDFPHLSDVEWDALAEINDTLGKSVAANIAMLPIPEQHSVLAAWRTHNRFARILEHTQSVPAPIPSPTSSLHIEGRTVRLDVTEYRGEERESLPRWLVEIQSAMAAMGLRDNTVNAAFAISKLDGRAKTWALGRKLADPEALLSFEALKEELTMAFQPPRCEFRMRQRFLALKQAGRNLYDYVSEARYLVSCVTEDPIDAATQVAVFLGGLRDGPVRTQLFREYPNTLEDAISIALQEEFSLKQAQRGGVD